MMNICKCYTFIYLLKGAWKYIIMFSSNKQKRTDLIKFQSFGCSFQGLSLCCVDLKFLFLMANRVRLLNRQNSRQGCHIFFNSKMCICFIGSWIWNLSSSRLWFISKEINFSFSFRRNNKSIRINHLTGHKYYKYNVIIK